MNRFLLSACLVTVCCTGNAGAEVKFPGKEPGKAQVECSGASATLSNKMFSVSFSKKGSGMVFGGMKQANGKEVVKSGTNLFTLTLGDGQTYTSAELKGSGLEEVNLKPDKSSPRLSHSLPGKAVKCTFTTPDGALEIEWRAVLRNDSHYLRQEMEVKAKKDTPFSKLTPLEYNVVRGGVPQLSGQTSHGKVVVNKLIFCGLETPMSQMSAPGGQLISGSDGGSWDPEQWSADCFAEVFNVPGKLASKYKETSGPIVVGIKAAEGPVNFKEAGDCTVTIGGKLNVVAVQLLPEGEEVPVGEDIHPVSKGKNYTVKVPEAGTYTLKIWADTKKQDIAGSGKISYSLPLESAEPEDNGGDALVTGDWVRKTTLQAKQSWKVSSVLGFFAPKQQRRSFLAYLERERAVPFRLFIHYNDWYEIGINCNFPDDPRQRHSEKKIMDVLEVWKREMVQKRKTPIDAFVIDDGWDDFNSLWGFHVGFPNGFSKVDKMLRSMKSGLGTWLGPVGGYGNAKKRRVEFWNKNHPNNQIPEFKLSYKEYFDAFVGCCSKMVREYNMRYFKFDGISSHFHATGPGNLEDAEGILSVLTELRKAKPDLFINTTVGTWSSPFWLMYSDSLWRQENDFGTSGSNGDSRDRWMNYRDRLVHEAFVRRSPLYPINSVMTHGIIITKHGPPQEMSKDPENCIKEIRSHIGCGTCLQELYVDRDLLNQQNGRLWNELAEGIKWLRRNEDVLADIHWVGGNPLDKETGESELYGWAAWSPTKCTLTFRNPCNERKTLTSTLRQILDVPPSVKSDRVTFRSSFRDQRNLPGLIGKAVDIDESISITIEPYEVIVMEGICEAGSGKEADDGGKKKGKKRKKGKKGKKKGKKKKK